MASTFYNSYLAIVTADTACGGSEIVLLIKPNPRGSSPKTTILHHKTTPLTELAPTEMLKERLKRRKYEWSFAEFDNILEMSDSEHEQKRFTHTIASLHPHD